MEVGGGGLWRWDINAQEERKLNVSHKQISVSSQILPSNAVQYLDTNNNKATFSLVFLYFTFSFTEKENPK